MALKIIRKDVGTHELKIMRHLRDSPTAHANVTHPGRKFVVQLLDDFDVGASHKCLVLEVMGRRIAFRAEEFTGGRLPGSMAREVTYQVVLDWTTFGNVVWRMEVKIYLYRQCDLLTINQSQIYMEEMFFSRLPRYPRWGKSDSDPTLGSQKQAQCNG